MMHEGTLVIVKPRCVGTRYCLSFRRVNPLRQLRPQTLMLKDLEMPLIPVENWPSATTRPCHVKSPKSYPRRLPETPKYQSTPKDIRPMISKGIDNLHDLIPLQNRFHVHPDRTANALPSAPSTTKNLQPLPTPPLSSPPSPTHNSLTSPPLRHLIIGAQWL